MNKIIIVDDEMLARIGIKSLISGNEKEYVVVGEAENGKKALEMIEELHPDIVITDMKMPVMNGIDLIKQAKELLNPPDFIVLSSYDDFDYVKQALVLGAKDYFLKLELTPEQLISTLDRVSKIRSEIGKEERMKQSYVEHFSSKDIEIVKGMFLKEIIQGSYYKENEIEQKLQDLGVTLPQGRIQVGVILLNGTEIHKKYKDKDIDLFQFSVQNIISEIVSDYRYAHTVFTRSNEITVIYGQMKDVEMSQTIEDLMSTMLKALKTYLNITGLIGISGIHVEYNSIKIGYKEALTNASQHQMSNGLVESVNNSDSLFLNINDYIKQFDMIIEISDIVRMEQCLGSIIKIIKARHSVDKHVLKSLCSALLFSISSYVAEQHPTFKIEEEWESDPYHSLDHLYTDYDYIVWIQRLMKTTDLLFNALGESRKIIHEAKKFIQSHYAKNISLEAIAEELNISPNYLSHLFRKETKESVVEYITRYRIDQAKKLLRTTHYKVYEVGQMVGYESEQYFSRVFKKVVGIPPAKYKM